MLHIGITASPCLSSRDIVSIRKKVPFQTFFPNISIYFLSIMRIFDIVLKGIHIRLLQHHKKQQPKTSRVAFLYPKKKQLISSWSTSQSFYLDFKKANRKNISHTHKQKNAPQKILVLYSQLKGECELVYTSKALFRVWGVF